MKIVIISIKPTTLNSGSEVRNYYLLKGLKKQFKVSYIIPTVHTELPTDNVVTRLKYILIGKVPYIEYLQKAILDPKTIEIVKQADIIQLGELESFFAVEKYLSQFTAPIVLDAHNVEFKRFLSDLESKSFLMKIIGKILVVKIKEMEIDALKKINYLITCSKIDTKYFERYFPSNKIIYIPNGVDCNSIKNKKIENTNNVLFMGLLSYGPNESGIKYYLQKIHPLVKKINNKVKITILGRNPPFWLTTLAQLDNTIKLKGFVEDIREELYTSSLCICPLRSGSGTRLKVLEYMAAGRPVVSTSQGSEGIEAINGKHILIADNPQKFANDILLILKDNKYGNKIGESGRKLVEEKYNWQKITNILVKFYIKLQ